MVQLEILRALQGLDELSANLPRAVMRLPWEALSPLEAVYR
jgi:hypothetical protein